MNPLKKLKSVFSDGNNYKYLLLSILITGLSYGLYKGMLDNYLAEIVGMGEMDRGIAEFFREIPGILLVLILAAFYMLSAEAMYKAGALIMMVGMGMHAVLPPSKLLVVLAICVYSLGEHIQIGMKPRLRRCSIGCSEFRLSDWYPWRISCDHCHILSRRCSRHL